MDTTFKGKAKPLDDIDLPRIGSLIGVGEDEIHAFMDVEASGTPFDKKGRPKMLFEPHVFYRNLTGKKRQEAVAAGLAYKKWGEQRYPSDSYPRLIRAMAIDETAALKSASWGLSQILGENHEAAGYLEVQTMVADFMYSAASQLQATVKLLKAWQIDDDLRAHRWAKIASVWNGPGYKKNRYDVKLAAAFKKWQRIRDTPYTPEPAGKPVGAREPAPAPKPVRPAPRPPAPPPAGKEIKIVPIEVPGLDKPLPKSTTFWATIVGFVTSVVGAIQALDWRIALALIVVAAAAAAWIIRERRKYRNEQRDIVEVFKA
jgi:hypothetical protein